MKFENDTGEPVEINFKNFKSILSTAEAGFTRVKLKDGQVVTVQATENKILEATVEK